MTVRSSPPGQAPFISHYFSLQALPVGLYIINSTVRTAEETELGADVGNSYYEGMNRFEKTKTGVIMYAFLVVAVIDVRRFGFVGLRVVE